jgi:segregation and condensation protein B
MIALPLGCAFVEISALKPMDFYLPNIIKALLFSTSDPLAIKDIQTVLTRYHREYSAEDRDWESGAESEGMASPEQGLMREVLEQVPSMVTASQIRDAIEAITAELEEENGVYRISEGPSGYRMLICPQYADLVRLLRNESKPQRLTQAAMETLAVVAYRQPVTRAEIESIRGVSIDSALNRLMELDLVIVKGRADLPGRPIQYGTSDRFLEFCGVRSLDELPASDVLSPNQISEWIRKASHPEPVNAALGMELDFN